MSTANSHNVVEARGLTKTYGSLRAVDNISFDIPSGRIVGVIGSNGAGKTTMLNAVLGLLPYEGELKVLGKDPLKDRAELMHDVCFIADVATLPRWMRVSQVLDYVEGVHDRFDRAKAHAYLARTEIPLNKRIRGLSKGMTVQLHLSIVMAIDAKLLVLDEPTLGLDIIFRKRFYSNLLADYFDEDKTIIVTTHQVEEIEHILTDALFIRDGGIDLYASLEELAETYTQLVTDTARADEARALGPLAERDLLGRKAFVFEGADKAKLAELGELHRIGLSDLFVVRMTGEMA